MPIYKIDLPGDTGDLYVRYKIKHDGDLKIKEQRIKWSSRNYIEDAQVTGTGNANAESFTVKVVFNGNHWAVYSGTIRSDGTGRGSAESSWQGKFHFNILKMPKGTTFESLLNN